MKAPAITLYLIFCFSGSFCLAQEDLTGPSVTGGLDRNQRINTIRSGTRMQPRVIAPTLTAEEFDQLVLNRLMQEIARSPAVAMIRLGVDDGQLQDIFIAISNARSFINGSEMANVRAMCNTWDDSALEGEARISEALAAYVSREKFTRNFITKYYRVVMLEIESSLTSEAKAAFGNYMDDRRGRMANAGIVSRGLNVQNLRDGMETIRFHCREQIQGASD